MSSFDLTEFLQVLALALLPAIGNLLGALIAEGLTIPRWIVGAALHTAAGIAIALISIDLMPRIMGELSVLSLSIAFFIGAAISFLIARGLAMLGDSRKQTKLSGWLVCVAIGTDLVSDGLMTGAGAAVEMRLGLLLAATQLIANIPGGFASTANLKSKNVARHVRMSIAGGMFLAVGLSTALGFLFLRDSSEATKMLVLAGMVGLLLLTTVEDIIPEGDAPRPPRWSSTLAFTLGFIGLALAAGYL